uniref:Uncharacterized protein n=1 Tax=uncultured marine group II/III euryarchaeote KM3_88_D11 TaxID=1456535 RepID=A0A075HZT4_9EURY|nr:hypothetical protein [uncultured marine group II/III euryarchaeote KM3_88_D11]
MSDLASSRDAANMSSGEPARLTSGNSKSGCMEVFPAMHITVCPILWRCCAIVHPVDPEEAFWIALTESIGALLAPSDMATIFLLGILELTRLHSSATIVTASGCFLRPSSCSECNTELPSSLSLSISSDVTGSSNRSECIEGTNRVGVWLPRAADRAMVTGESMTP